MAFNVGNASLRNFTATMVTSEEWQQRVYTTTLFVFFGSCGIILNALPILLTFCTELRKNKIHIVVANLSAADLLFSVSFVFGQTHYILYREQIDITACRWLAFFTFTTAMLEFLLPPILSVNRYVSLYHNEHYDRLYKIRNIALMVAGSWIFATIIPLIFTLSGKTGFDDDNMHCCIVVKNSPPGWSVFYWITIIVPLVVFCDGTMMFCNFKIYQKLFQHKAQNGLKRNVVRQNKELLHFLVADMTFPILFHTTYHVAKFASINRVGLIRKRVFTCLYLINSCVRGLVTLTLLRPYRLAVKNLLRLLTCNSVNAIAPAATRTGATEKPVSVAQMKAGPNGKYEDNK